MKRATILIIGLAIMFIGGVSGAFAQHKVAFLVGISDYGNKNDDPNEWTNISGVNDVNLLTPQFKKQGFSVTKLVDREAKHDNIIKGLQKLADSSKPGDIVYVHFSMHGQPFEDIDGDEKDGWDEALIPVDAKKTYKKGVYEGGNHLIDDELVVYINKIRDKLGPNGILYVVIDACHAGGSSRGEDDEIVRGTRDGFSPSGKIYKPQVSEANNYFNVKTLQGQSPVFYLEACHSYQTNKEIRDTLTNITYGPLSYYVAKTMEKYQIGKTADWIYVVEDSMKADRIMQKNRQYMVIEKSE